MVQPASAWYMPRGKIGPYGGISAVLTTHNMIVEKWLK